MSRSHREMDSKEMDSKPYPTCSTPPSISQLSYCLKKLGLICWKPSSSVRMCRLRNLWSAQYSPLVPLIWSPWLVMAEFFSEHTQEV